MHVRPHRWPISCPTSSAGEERTAPLSAKGPAPALYATAPSDGFVLRHPETDPYSFDKAIDHVASIPILTTGIVAGTFAIGIADWKWGSASFHFTDEGFFGKDTHDLGMDKLGHAFGTYVLTDLFTHAIRRKAGDPKEPS